MKKPKKFDAVAMLRKIAADENAGSTARVQALKFLVAHDRDCGDDEKTGKDAPPADAVTRRALRLLNGGKSA